MVTTVPGVACIMTVLAAEGAKTVAFACALNMPRSAVTTPIKTGALARLFRVTMTFTDGTPAAISNGTCTSSWVGLA